MKSTGVVQGFKSFLDKLHPTLPLTSSESSHLLSTLKSSFRNHLDAVHPQTARGVDPQGRGKAVLNLTKLQPDQVHMRSSVAAAESHLSSILTNRLLAATPTDAQPGGAPASSKLLSKRSTVISQQDEDFIAMQSAFQEGKAPIDLLEERHQAGKTTVSLAFHCLQAFKDTLNELPEDRHLEAIRTVHPGKRTFQCLWGSGLHTSSLFLMNRRFNEILIHFMLLEDHEQDLWEWVQLDIGQAGEHATVSDQVRDVSTVMLSVSQWKGRLLAVMAEKKLYPPFGRGASASDAMSVCLKASHIKLSARSSSSASSSNKHMSRLSIAPCMNTVFLHYNREPNRFKATDCTSFNSFIDTMAASSDHPINLMFVAMLLTVHPTKPSGTPLLNQLKLMLAPNPPHARLSQLYDSIVAKPLVYLPGILRAIVRLEQSGNAEDAAWMQSKIPELFPAQVRHQRTVSGMRHELGAMKMTEMPVKARDDVLIEGESLAICT
nr:hypothetical protein CFP56_10220 [Quercus suber]